MEIFDTLPPVVRRAIACAGFEFAPRFAVKLLGRGVTAERAAQIIHDTDLRISSKRSVQ